MIEPVIISFVAPTWNDELKRFRGGPFVKEVLNNFRGKLDGSNLLNLSLYSAHDTSLSAVMNTMGVFNDAVPPFAALLLIELRMPFDSSEPVVSMWYKNSTKEPFLLEMPDCGSCCPLAQMERRLKPVIPENWEKECQENTEENNIPSK
uniref:acid phosphatase n=1 Tax=Lygus hesperus TaxID=30085 RepID=A0A0K8SQ83_LYGHE